LNLDDALDRADLVLVHEWNDPSLVARIGHHHSKAGDYSLFFHDTHHRSVTAPHSMAEYDLRYYDGVLAYGASIRDVYLRNKWSNNVWVWHEAADTRIFRPMRRGCSQLDLNASNNHNGNGHSHKLVHPLSTANEGHVVWIGNWGDEERAAEIHEFLIAPIKELGLKARVYGVRYPPSAIKALADADIEYAGWVPNFNVPKIFSRFRVTLHIPRRPYVEALPGIPTIRPFEAMACGIPLICANWKDSESLFTPGRDYLLARHGREMTRHLRTLVTQPIWAQELAEHGLQTVLQRHTCRHRAEALLSIYRRNRILAEGVPA
jgi:spore maturation protein CgeB